MPPIALPDTVRWHQNRLWIIDQTLLPSELKSIALDSADAVWEAIQSLRVRGAPAIGVAAAYGLCVAIRPYLGNSSADFRSQIRKQAAYLNASRPTAVNLKWALDAMLQSADACTANTANQDLFDQLVACAVALHKDDRAQCQRIGEAGLPLIQPGMGILTHCNAGALATTGLGTATAPLYLAHQQGIAFRVYADETRPLLQGARLTSWELQHAGIEVSLQTDSMAAHLMAQGLIDLVIVGTDRVAANGDIANKIGTLSLAINAHYFGIPFYVAFPSSTLDQATACGADIVIEERGREEVTHLQGHATAPEAINVHNPAFDVTPAHLITGFITDQGLLLPPLPDALKRHFSVPGAQQ